MKQSEQTEFEKLSWKEICMRLLRCFGENNNDWFHRDWHEYGIDKKHGKIIVEQYEQWMLDNGIKVVDFRKKQFKCECEKAKYEHQRAKYRPKPQRDK